MSCFARVKEVMHSPVLVVQYMGDDQVHLVWQERPPASSDTASSQLDWPVLSSDRVSFKQVAPAPVLVAHSSQPAPAYEVLKSLFADTWQACIRVQQPAATWNFGFRHGRPRAFLLVRVVADTCLRSRTWRASPCLRAANAAKLLSGLADSGPAQVAGE